MIREVLMETTLRSRADGRDHPARIGVLAPSDRDAVLAVQTAGLGELMHPIGPAQAESMLGDGGRTVGVEVDGRLAGFFAVRLPDRGPENLGHDAGLTGGALDRVAHWTAVIVHPDWRGNGLQRCFIEVMRTAVLPAPRVWLATARVENRPSVRNFLAAGLRIVRVMPKYDGRPRYLFRQDLPGETALRWSDRTRPLPFEDHAAQARLFAEGWSAVGMAAGSSADPARTLLLFRRPAHRPEPVAS